MAAIAVAGALSHGSLPKHPDKQGDSAPTAQTGQQTSFSKPVQALSKPVQALCKQLGYTDPQTSCLADLKKNRKVQSLIATVADPKRTNLALYFDRTVDSLIWASGDSGYTFQSYWLPWSSGEAQLTAPAWKTEASPEDEDPDNSPVNGDADDTAQPGFLLFRGSQPGKFFVIWLVGESPTAGLETDAFEAALDNLENSDADPKKVRIVGPSFSGSFASLGNALNNALKTRQIQFNVITGMATSLDAQLHFVSGVPASKLTFKSTVENDLYALSRFVAYLQHHWGSTGEIAVLAEDQTVYGQAIQSYLWEVISGHRKSEKSAQLGTEGLSAERWLLLRFPREIAQLRNRYEAEMARAAAAAQKQNSSAPPEGDLSLSLKSPGEGTDNVPEFSTEQSPLSQEAVLLDMANALQHEHVRYAVVLATDVLDQIFIVRFLQHACPDVRLVLFDSDLLFAGAEMTTALEGVLNVTTYPLFLRNQHWTEAELLGKLPQRIPFASRSAEGVYNAARAQLCYLNSCETQPHKAGSQSQDEIMLDYFHPDKNPAWHPPLWLTVLGKTGYWPVALLDEETVAAEKNQSCAGVKNKTLAQKENPPCSSLMESPVPESRSKERLHPEEPSHGWSLVLLAISVAGLLHCFYFWLTYLPQQTGRLGPSDSRLAVVRKALYSIFWIYPPGAKWIFNRLLLVVILAFAAGELALTTSGVPYFWESGSSFSSEAFYFGLPFLALILLVLAAIQLSFRHWRKENLLPWFFCLLFFGLWLVIVSGSRFDDMRVYFFAYRMLQPASGASPAPPVLLLLAVPGAWGFVQLAREGGEETPRVPALSDPLQNAEKLSGWLRQIMPMVFIGYVVVLILMLFLNQLRSIEDRSYDTLINFLVMLCYFLMFATWTQLLITWWYFRRFLESLERHPMRDAFSRMPKELATLPLIRKGRQKPFILASARCLDTLTALSRSSTGPGEKQLEEQQLKAQYALQAVEGSQYLDELLLHDREGKREELYNFAQIAKTKGQLEVSIRASADALIAWAEKTYWCEGKSESVELEEQSDKREKLGRLNDREMDRILTEEFIALRFVMYILYVLGQMHKLMWFVVISFVLTVLAMSVYPFKSPRLIDFSSLVVFAVLAVGTSIVLAQMERDSILSRLTATTPNEIGKNFFVRLASFGALPLLTVLSTQFPAIRNFLFSWLQPALQALGNSG